MALSDFESTMEWKIDITQFTKGMQEAKAVLKSTNSEFNLTSSTMEKWSDNITGLEAKIKQLGNQMEAEARMVELYKQAWEQAKKEFGETSPEAERLAGLIEKHTVNFNKAEVNLAKYSTRLNQMNAEQTKSVSKYEELNRVINEQQQKVNDLKEEYASAVLQYGKTSSQAQELAKQLKEVSSELADNKKKMKETDDAADKLDKSIDEVGESATAAANGGFTVLKGALANLVSQGISRVVDGFRTLTKNAVSYQKSLEGYQTSFEVMTGSASKAAETVERLSKISVETPFDMPTLAESTQLLMNFGLSADEAIDSMMMLGDISQGSSEKMSRIALAYGQMSSAGKVHLQDIKQMIEAGFNPLQEISETTGESMESLYKRISKGTISVDEIKKAFVRATSEGGKYFQSMDKQSLTLEGRMATLQETVNSALGKTFTPLLKRLADTLLPRVTELINNMDTSKLAKGFAEFGDAAIKAFEWIVKNGGEVVDIIQAIAVAFVTYKAVSTIGTVTGAFTTLFKTIKAGEGVMKGLNLAFGATPVGLLATGIAAVVGVTTLMVKHTNEQIKAQYGLNKEQQEAIDAADALAFKYKELDKARAQAVDNINAEYSYLGDLKKEYNGLIDSNGKVKKGYEDRANFILNELAKAMGMEVDDIKKLIDKNGELGESIDKVIKKKQAEAILLANEELYNTAIRERASALQEVTSAQSALEEADKKRKDAQEKANEVWDKYNKLVKESPEAARAYLQANSDIIQGNQEAKKSYDEAKGKVEEAELAWIGYNSTIQNYEGLSAAIISGDASKIEEAMRNMTNSFITAENGNRESLENQVKNYKTNLENLENAIKAGTPGVTQEMVNQAKAMVEAAEAELDKLPPEASAKGAKAGTDFANSMGSKKPQALQMAGELANGAEIGINPAIDKLSKTGSKAGTQFGDSVGSTANKTNAKSKGEDLANEADTGAKSVDGSSAGHDFGAGFASGMTLGDVLSSVASAAAGLAGAALSALRNALSINSPSRKARVFGVGFGEGFQYGIEDMFSTVSSSASRMADTALDSLGNALGDQMRVIGEDGGKSLIDGMNGMMPNLSSSVTNLKESVASANGMMSDESPINVGSFGSEGSKSQTVVFNQTINSPKAVDRLTLYRETNSLLFGAKVRLNNV